MELVTIYSFQAIYKTETSKSIVVQMDIVIVSTHCARFLLLLF